MRTPSFREITNILNLNNHIDIEEEPSKEGKRWALHWSKHTVQGFENKFRVVYLKSNATKKDIEEASKEVVGGQTFVIYPPSLDDKQDLHRSLLKGKAEKFQTSKEYLKSPISEEIEKYTDKLKDQKKDKYIEPRFENKTLKRPNPVKSFLRKNTFNKKEGGIGVILAEPGQGKTYMSRHIVGEIAYHSYGIVPILVDSSQWDKMAVEDQKSIWKTIAHSFRYFGAPINWIQGNENRFLESTLKADIFRIVFDGFDEYILRNKGIVNPNEVLSTLHSLALSTGTRIVITSRTSFWKNKIQEEKRKELRDRDEFEIFKIKPFDESKAKNYFEKNTESDRSKSNAIEIYKGIRGDNEKFVGKGFVISLIADAAESGEVSGSWAPREIANNRSDALMWLMRTLCRREERRQDLEIDENDQMSILQSISYERSRRSVVDDDTLDLFIMEEMPNIDEKRINNTREKLVSHPILKRGIRGEKEYWGFEQAQVEIALLAKEILDMESKRLARRAHALEIEPENVPDLSTFLVDMSVSRSSSRGDAINRISRLVDDISNTDVYGLQAKLVLSAVDEFVPQGRPRRDRTEVLLKLTGRSDVSNIRFLGSTIRSLDLEGVKFEGCELREVTFANSKFSRKTVFENCRFIGGIPPKNCDSFGLSNFEKCSFDKKSKTWIFNEKCREGISSYSKSQLRREIQLVVGNFTEKNSDIIKSSSKEEISNGAISSSPKKEKIMSALEEKVIDFESGEAFISKEAKNDVSFFSMNNNFRGNLREVFNKISEEIDLKE